MPCSLAQYEANVKNAQKSTGPKTTAGKQRSRANSLKHGLTGDGIVIPTEDAAALDLRFAALDAELNPAGTLARQLVGRIALMTIRLDRSAQHEAQAIGHRMRKARAEFDDARFAEMESHYSWIVSEPATNARRLRMMPEGISRLIDVITDLRGDLDHPEGHRWDWARCEQFHHLTGLRRVDVPVSRARALSDAMEGNFRNLNQSDGGDLPLKERQEWARVTLLGLVDEELARLRASRDQFDHEGLELDREGAAHRAMFDASPAATLARKYEATSERSLYRALREFREVQGDVTQTEQDGPVASDPAEEMGSSLPDSGEGIIEEAIVDSIWEIQSGPAVEVSEKSSPEPQKRPNLDKIRSRHKR